MIKVAYLAPYRDGTGYAKGAIEYILALDAVGIKVAPRPIRMTNTTGEVPNRIKELEDNDLNNVDAVIQHSLPSTFERSNGVQNIGMFAYETSNFINSGWRKNLELMDDVVVSCVQQRWAIEITCGSYTRFRTHVMPYPVDTEKFKKQYKPIDFGVPKNATIFYTIAELGRRKNLEALILAYYATFTASDNVLLVIKTHSPSRDRSAASILKQTTDDLKRQMGRFHDASQYPKIAVLGEYMSDEDICRLHATCHCFVTASHGEAWCLPAIDAFGFGNKVVAPANMAFADYNDYDINPYHVCGSRSVVFGVNNAPDGLYTADETWFNVETASLASILRDIIGEKDDIRNTVKILEAHLSRRAVGQQLASILKDRA